jgi:hypothetical protein
VKRDGEMYGFYRPEEWREGCSGEGGKSGNGGSRGGDGGAVNQRRVADATGSYCPAVAAWFRG